MTVGTMMRISILLALVVGLISCKPQAEEPEGGLESASQGHYSELRDRDQLVRVLGSWRVTGDGTAAAASFVEEHRATLELLDGVVLGDPVELDDDGDAIQIPLTFGGHAVYGGEVRVRLAGSGENRRIVTVSVTQPTGFDDADSTVSAEEAEASTVAEGLEVTGTPRLWWLSTGMVLGEPDDAKLVWRVPTRGSDAIAPSVRWLDAADGSIVWDDRRVAHFTEVRDADGDGGRLDVITEEDTLTRVVYRDGNLVGGEVADPEATAASELAAQACGRMQARFGEGLPCDDLSIIVDISSNPAGASDPNDAFASCNPSDEGECTDSILGFGPTTLLWESGRQTFEHEFWHAFVDRTVPLAGTGEPAAVNESFADLNALFATRPGGEWLLGIGNPGEAEYVLERNASNPAETGHPTHFDQLAPADLQAPERAHANGVLLTHGMWRAVVTGGTVEGQAWAPLPYDQAERLLYLATKNGLGQTTTLKRAAENLAVECVLAVVDAIEDGDLGNPPHGLRQQHCGALVNGFAEVGLMEQDRDVDGLWDGIDPCPDNADITDVWEFGTTDCDDLTDEPDAGSPPDMGSDPGFVCEGRSLDCPPTYTDSSGLVRDLDDGRGQCFGRDMTNGPNDGAAVANCSYFLEDGSEGVGFHLHYRDDRDDPGRGCFVDEDRWLNEVIRVIPHPTRRAWVEYSGADRLEENPIRQSFAEALLEQVADDALPCDVVECATLTDHLGEQVPAFPVSVPWRQYREPGPYTNAGCRYDAEGVYFRMRWAQDPDEALACPEMPADPASGTINDAIVQARVDFPATADEAGNAARVALANSYFEQIRTRALPCP